MLFRYITNNSTIRLMVSVILCALLMSACSNGTGTPAKEDDLTENEVREFIKAYDKAWSERDTMALKDMIDEKYIYFTSVGSTLKRNSIMSWFTPADKYKVDTAVRNEIEVTLNGNTAIVSSHWVGSGSFGEERFNDDQRCGLVVRKVGGKVRVIEEHCVQIAKKE